MKHTVSFALPSHVLHLKLVVWICVGLEILRKCLDV